MIIYRVETREGEGVHASGHAPRNNDEYRNRPMPRGHWRAFKCACPREFTMRNVETGVEERWIGRPEHQIFGFPTMSALCNWFDAADRATMRAEGYVWVALFEVEPASVLSFEDGLQVMFHRCAATRLGTQEIPA